jgi:catechol 2,3-dioxygenase-like lactoylglutathione lyase family enzyme
MPKMTLDAVSVTSTNLERSVKFYSALGFKFGTVAVDAKHVEPITQDGAVRLMIDDCELIKSITGIDPVPPTHSSFAMKCESPQSVDAATATIKAAGFKVVKEPWNTFWGQRYAIVADPDGYMIDLFAPLSLG